MAGKLLLLPNLLGDTADPDFAFTPSIKIAVSRIQGLIAESEKEGRRYLLRFLPREEMVKRPLALLHEHTEPKELSSLLLPMEKGEVWGLISDAGLPCIADPGEGLVRLAYQKGVEVESLGGTSSQLLALQLSGFCGQRYAFHGYLPREEKELEIKLKQLEQQCRGMTQMWMEAPYRTAKMVEAVCSFLSPATLFCVASQLMTKEQRVISQPIARWKKSSYSFGKEPAIFLLYA
ncbi:MAG TPA: SAM-dependent methyltransferase [Chlamydiales bacterium]|nr:SAM-dependent methyltransferase [Chlamydiales bacterium]